MEPQALLPDEATPRAQPTVSLAGAPAATPLPARKAVQLIDEMPAPQPSSAPPTPYAFGARVLMWKQDPSVTELGTRQAFLPGVVLAGPRDARIVCGEGTVQVAPNAAGDFLAAPDTPQFDAVHTFAVVRQTLTMYQRALSSSGADMPLPWQWNSSLDTSPLQLFPYGLPDVMNAFYSRSQACLKFGDFVPTGASARIYTCRSLDIVAHETGHAVLDGLKPRWLEANQPPQTGGLHEAFGDLSAIFLALSQLDQCEAIVAQTKARLHDKSFLADIAEQVGLALGSANGLRNADNDLKLSAAGTEVHAISQVFTGALYDILADLFTLERNPAREDDAFVLHRVGGYLRALLLRALIAAPDDAASFADVANALLQLVHADGKPVAYANCIRDRFAAREVLQSQVPPGVDHQPGLRLAPLVSDAPGAAQDRRACCGTMNLAEYHAAQQALEDEARALARWCLAHGRTGTASTEASEAAR
jgi:hypothetical protein